MNIDEKLLSNVVSKALDRRSFLRRSGGAAALLAGASMLGSNSAEAAPTATDVAVLNFALNLEYLEAEYYIYGMTGQGIFEQGAGVYGTGTLGPTIVKANPKVNFDTPLLEEYGAEIAADELAHVEYLRKALGSARIGKPKLDLQGSFNTLAQAAGLGDSFDPFANEVNFLIGGFIFEDVGVTAYKGAAPLLTDKAVLGDAAAVLAVEAYHAGVIRATLLGLSRREGGENIVSIVQKISDARDSLDIYRNGRNFNTDQGITNADGTANAVPTNVNALAFGRTTRQVLNIVYGKIDAPRGLFFPNGFNGAITK